MKVKIKDTAQEKASVWLGLGLQPFLHALKNLCVLLGDWLGLSFMERGEVWASTDDLAAWSITYFFQPNYFV